MLHVGKTYWALKRRYEAGAIQAYTFRRNMNVISLTHVIAEFLHHPEEDIINFQDPEPERNETNHHNIQENLKLFHSHFSK